MNEIFPLADPAVHPAADPITSPLSIPTVGPAISTTVQLTVNGKACTLAADATLAEAVATLSTAPRGVAAALNESVVPRSAWTRTLLHSGDRVEILTAVQGG